MAGKYTKELKWHTITVLENLWDIRFVQVPAKLSLYRLMNHFYIDL